MQKKVIWESGEIKLIQISWDNLCVNAVMVKDNIVQASTDWDTIQKYLDQLVQ